MNRMFITVKMFFALFDDGFNKFPCKAYFNFVSEKIHNAFNGYIKKESYSLKMDNLTK